MATPERTEYLRAELARMLRRLRDESGLTGTEAARRAGFSQSKLSKIETGALVPAVADVETICRSLHAPPRRRKAALDLARMVNAELESRRIILQRGAYRRQQEVARTEAATDHLRDFDPTMVMGLLQTRDYMRVVFAEGVDEPELDRAVDARLGRARVLADESKRFTFILTDGALRWNVGGPPVMVPQIEHLIEVSRRPNVKLGLIPWRTPVRVFPAHGFIVFDDRLVVADIRLSLVTVQDPRDIGRYLDLFAALEDHAVFDDAARVELSRIAEEYRLLTKT